MKKIPAYARKMILKQVRPVSRGLEKLIDSLEEAKKIDEGFPAQDLELIRAVRQATRSLNRVAELIE